MARITVEDCLDKVNNRFALVLLVAKRTKQLMKGEWPNYRLMKEQVKGEERRLEFALRIVRLMEYLVGQYKDEDTMYRKMLEYYGILEMIVIQGERFRQAIVQFFGLR